VVPLDVGRSAISDAETRSAGSSAVARSDQKGIVPAAWSPITIVAVIAVWAVTPRSFCPVGPAVVTSHRAPVCRSWRAISSPVHCGFTVVTIAPIEAAANHATANSMEFCAHKARTSPGRRPRADNPAPTSRTASARSA
jgi:hypothetical protein